MEPTQTVGELRAAVAQLIDSPTEGLRMICSGRILGKDSDVLSSLNLPENSTIHAVPQARPAPQPASEPSPQSSQQAPGDLFSGLDMSQFMGGSIQDFAERLMNDPDTLQRVIASNPQFRQLMNTNPEAARLLSDPSAMRDAMQAMTDPVAMRQYDNMLNQASFNPEVLSRATATMQQIEDAALPGDANSVPRSTHAGPSSQLANPFARGSQQQESIFPGLGPADPELIERVRQSARRAVVDLHWVTEEEARANRISHLSTALLLGNSDSIRRIFANPELSRRYTSRPVQKAMLDITLGLETLTRAGLTPVLGMPSVRLDAARINELRQNLDTFPELDLDNLPPLEVEEEHQPRPQRSRPSANSQSPHPPVSPQPERPPQSAVEPAPASQSAAPTGPISVDELRQRYAAELHSLQEMGFAQTSEEEERILRMLGAA